MSISAGRKAKVEQGLRDVLAEMIARDVRDPRVTAAGLLSVTRVECNHDLSVARVYVSVYGDDAAAERAVAGLVGAAGFLRGPAGRKLNLAKPPELRFIRDASPEMSMKLAEVLREDEAKATAAGRRPGDPPPARAHDDEPTQVLGAPDDEPTADLHPAPAGAEDDP